MGAQRAHRPPLLALLLVAAFAADHVIGAQLQLSPSRDEHVTFDGKSLYVSCKGRDPVGMVWLGPGQKPIVSRRGAVRVEPSQDKGDGLTGVDLLLNPVKRKDRGKYTCRATVDGAEREVSFNLVVFKPITFDENQQTQYAAEGSNFTVLCDVTGDPQPEVDWRGVTHRLEFGENKKYDIDPETNGLIIRNVTRADEGMYRCKATQVSSKDSDLRNNDIQLQVQYKPEWSGETRREVYGYLRGEVNLTCRAEAKPPPKFLWYKDGQVLLDNPDYRQINSINMSVLKIRSLNATMFGEFVCRAENQVDFLEQEVILKEGLKPDIPTVRVTETGSQHLTLDISTPSRQEMATLGYRAQYKRADSQWRAANAVQFQTDGPFVINNLQPDTAYVIRVAARNEAGYGDFSPSLRQKTAPRPAEKPTNSSRALVLELLCALIMAALLVL